MALINREYRFHLDGRNAISQIRFSEEPTIRLHVDSDLAGDRASEAELRRWRERMLDHLAPRGDH